MSVRRKINYQEFDRFDHEITMVTNKSDLTSMVVLCDDDEQGLHVCVAKDVKRNQRLTTFGSVIHHISGKITQLMWIFIQITF